MRVLVTGATGFLGANLVRRLVERGDEVRCVVRQPNRLTEGLAVELIPCALADDPDAVDALARAMDGCEGVYHVAGAFDPAPGGIDRMRQVHVFGTRGLLRAAEKAGVRRMVVCSSSITVGYGDTPETAADEDTWPDADAVYGKAGALRAYYNTKRQEEELALGWARVEAVVVNPDYIIGPWDVKPTSGQLIVSLARRWMPFYPRGGKCFQHARDCADGHILAMDRGRPGRRYLLGNENLSYREFMGMIADVVGRRPPLFPLPDAALGLAGAAGELGARFDAHRFAGLDPYVLRAMQQGRYRSGERARVELGVPSTPVRDAVADAYAWFRESGYC